MGKPYGNMKLILVTVNLPPKWLKFIKEMVKEGWTPHVSEYIRDAVGLQMRRDMEIFKNVWEKINIKEQFSKKNGSPLS